MVYTRITGIIIVFTFLLISIQAQDRHYWDQAVGGRSALLGGIAVGGVSDYSATFYNPGALAFLKKNNLNFSFNMYGLKDFQFENGAGPGISPRYTRVSLFPSSLAGGIPFLGDSLNRFSYMIYGNGYSYLRVSERYEGYNDVIPARPYFQNVFNNAFEGKELLINQGKLDVLLQEVSVGFGYSKKIGENIGLGFSLFGAYRDQTKLRYETYQAYDTSSQRSATTDLYLDIDFWALRFYGKFGISADFEKFKLGLTLTTPGIPFIGGGTDGANLTSNNVFIYVDSTNNQVNQADLLASDRQEGLKPKYKSPLSIAAGFEYKILEKTTVHFAGEWFAPLSTYVVLQPNSHNFIRNTPSEVRALNSAELLKVYDATRSVFNFGFAVEQEINEKLTGYAAFRTDYSNANYGEIDGLTIGITDFNIYHFTLGASLVIEDTFIGAGIEYSHGQNSSFSQIFNFPSGEIHPQDIIILGERGTSKLIYNNFNIFFSATKLL